MLGKSSPLEFMLAFNEPETVQCLSGHHKDFGFHYESNRMSLNNSKQAWCSERFLRMLLRSGFKGSQSGRSGRVGLGHGWPRYDRVSPGAVN